MKIKDFLSEHDLTIKSFKANDEDQHVLIRNSDEKQISPAFSMKDAVILWITKNTNEIFFKLYNEEN